ncbi:MAG: tetratricopeptide repeat protein [Gaiellaceae bacterium]
MADEATRQESIGERLLRLRHEKGVSQLDLAGPGISTAHISRIESGTRQPSVKAIRLLARGLGVSSQYLETGSEMHPSDSLELRLTEAEVQVRLGDDLDSAFRTLLSVHAEASRAGEQALAARALVGLGLVATTRGNHAEAARFLEQAVEAGDLDPATHPDVFVTLGRMYWLLDEYERAAEFLEDALKQLETQPPEEVAAARATLMTYLSYALSSLGEFERARELLVRIHEEQEQGADLYGQARLHWSLARLATMEGKLPAALKHLRHSVALLESSEDNFHRARAQQLCAHVFNLDDQPELALKHLALAEELFGPGIDRIDLGLIRAEQAKALAKLDQGDEALERGLEATSLLEVEPSFMGSAWHGLARAHTARGESDEAISYYERAVERIAASPGEWREAVQACHGWAELLRQNGDGEGAARVLAHALEIEWQGTVRRTRSERDH